MTNHRSLCPIIVALDVNTKAEALEWVKKLGSSVDIFKVGLQLFSREGFGVIHAITKQGHRVFVDLKLHDIPNTVAHAVCALAQPGVEFLTLHASGGEKMLQAAVESLDKVRSQDSSISTRLLAVTVLTSMDDHDLHQIGVGRTVIEQVLHLTQLAHSVGIDGVVASPQETRLIRKEYAGEMVIVTPGIRLADGKTQDQKRVMTPAQAIKEGSDFLVMGRSLLEAPDAEKVLRRILAEISSFQRSSEK